MVRKELRASTEETRECVTRMLREKVKTMRSEEDGIYVEGFLPFSLMEEVVEFLRTAKKFQRITGVPRIQVKVLSDVPQTAIDPIVLEYVVSPKQSWRLLTAGMPRNSSDASVPFNPLSDWGMQKESINMIIDNNGNVPDRMNRCFCLTYVTWTNGRLIDLLPELLYLQLEYPLKRYIYRIGDKYTVGYKNEIQQVEYCEEEFSEALVLMMLYLLKHDCTKVQILW